MPSIRRILSLILLMFSLFLLPKSQVIGQVCTVGGLPANLQSGLVAYYPFCGNWDDISGNNNVLQAFGGSTTTDRFGTYNSAYSFTNTQTTVTNYFKALNPLAFAKPKYSISAWFNTSQLYPFIGGVTYNYQAIVTYSPQWYNYGAAYNVSLQHANNTILSAGHWTTTNLSQGLGTPNGTISINQWNHVVSTYDGTNLSLYLNGTLIGSTPASLSYANQIQFLIGGAGDGPSPGGIYGGFNGKIDDIGFWDRPLAACEVTQLYSATFFGFPSLGTFAYNSLSDTTRVCGLSTTLDAGSGYASYSWNTGATTQSITPTTSGFYKVTVTNASGCTAIDSTYLSLVNANIVNNDTTICSGNSVTLSLDSLFPGRTACNSNLLPSNFQNGLVGYWPFCGNASDVSGNSNNGTVNGATLTTDRFSSANSSYSFNGTNNYIRLANLINGLAGSNQATLTCWAKKDINTLGVLFGQWIANAQPTSPIGLFYVINSNNTLTASTDGGIDILTSQSATNTDSWNMYTLVYNSTEPLMADRLRIYQNGVRLSMSSFSVPNNIGSLSNFAAIGARGGGSLGLVYGFFKGKIDDPMAYTRALSAAEISSLYLNTAPPTVSWSTGATTNSITVNPTQTTTYYVTVTDGITTCTDSVVVTVAPTMTAGPASPSVGACVNQLMTPITHTTTGATGIGTVTGLPAGVTASWASNTITISGTPTQTGTFNYTIQLTGGCGTASATGTIAVATPPSAGTISVIRQLCSTAALQSALRTSLLSYYPMCGGLTDANGGTALSASNTSLTSGPYGYSNAAYTFNGTNSEMTIPYQNWYSSLTDNFTFSFWMKNNLPLGHSGAHILWRSDGNFSVGLNSNNTINFNRQGQTTLAVSSVALSSTWTHVVMIKAGASNKIYINGVLNTDNNNSTALSNTLNNPMIIGRASPGGNGGAYRFNGDLSQMMFYGRVLTAAEVNDLYVNEWMSLCSGSSATLTSTVAGGTWTSSNSAIATINPTTGSMTGIAAGTTTITYTVPGSGGCSSVSTVRSVNVISAGVLNALSDTTRVCGTSTTLDAGAGYAGYSWNTGATTQSISPTTNGIYKVTVTNAAGCTASDSTYLILVNANIINADTTICRGSSVTLYIDSSMSGRTACTLTGLNTGLRNGLVGYWPFCGNTNDVSGNGSNGLTGNVSLVADRFGQANSAYYFSGSSSSIGIPLNAQMNMIGNRTISCWYRAVGPQNGGRIFEQSNYNSGAGMYNGNILDVWNCSGNYDQNLVGLNAGSLNNWHLLTYTTNASSVEGRVYIDGVLVGTRVGAPAVCNTNWVGQFLNLGRGNAGESFVGDIDDVAVWDRTLSASEVMQLYSLQSVTWSTGATTNSITVSPTQTTTYYVTVTDGITTCTDSVKVTVSDIGTFNPLSDTTRICGTSTTLNAGTGYASYTWNTGATTQSITSTISGFYKVTVTNAAGCSTSDSTYLSLVNANILNNDTSICMGSSITLSIDSLFPGRTVCNASQLPVNLRNGLVGYWPFCGNANDMSGNGNNGVVNGATLAFDRYGQPLNAYHFDGISNFISLTDLDLQSEATISFWFYPLGAYGAFTSKNRDASGNSGYEILYNNSTIGLYAHLGWSGSQSNNIFPSPFSYVQLSQWQHAVLVVRNGFTQLYKNGILIYTQTGTNPISQNNELLLFGKSVWGGNLYHGKLDDIAIWNRGLSDAEVFQVYNTGTTVTWSTGATTNSITVSPTQTTTYYVTVTDGITTCTDSVKVTVSDIGAFNPLSDTTRICGTSTTLNAGTGYASYTWNTGATTQSITPTTSGIYKVTVTNASGCSASDSTYLSLVNANILNNDTTICKGASITLSIDSLFPGRTVCNANQLPTNLRNGLVGFWPFCGNANDASGNGNNASFANGRFSTDRFGLISSAYLLNGLNEYVEVTSPSNLPIGNSARTYSIWAKYSNSLMGGAFNDWNSLICQGNFSQNCGGTYFLANNNQSVIFASAAGAGPCGSLNPQGLSIINSWHHYVVTYDGSESIFYLDGIRVSSSVFINQLSTASGSLSFGVLRNILNPSQLYHLNGSIDDVAIYNRALSASDIWGLYSNQPSVTWSTGATTNSITVSPTQTTTYYVTVTDGITTCTDSVKVTVSTVDTSLTVLDPTSICSVNGQVRMQAGVASSYQWLRNGTAISGANAQSYTAVQTGAYRVVVSNAIGCTDTSRTVNITLNPLPVVGFAINDTIQCLTGNNFVFTNTSTIGGGDVLSYLWNFGDGNTATTINAANAYSAPGNYTVTLIATGSSGCVDSSRVTVSVLNSPVASFNINNLSQCITGNNFIFTNTSTSGGGAATYLWNLGDGTTATTQNVTHAYLTPSVYNVTLYVTNGSACIDSVTQQVIVNVLPSVSFTINDTTQCLTGNQFTFTSTATINPGLLSWQWNLGDGSTSTDTVVNHTYATHGTYLVTLVATSDAGCTDSIRQQVYVYPEPIARFTVNDSTQCENGNNFIFNNTSTIAAGPLGFSWNFGDGSPTNSQTSPSHVYQTSGPFVVTLIATGDNGCADTTTRNMLVYPKPVLSFTVNDSTQCVGGNSFVFNNTSTVSAGTNTYVWYFGNGASSPLQNPTYSYPQPGTYTVTLIAITDNGCIDSVRRTMVVYPNPTVRFTVNDTTQCIQGNSFVFTNNTNINPAAALTYQWNFGNGATSTNISPTYVYASPGTYTVTLIANSAEGCIDSARQTVYVYAMPTGTLQTPASTIICQGSSVTLTATGGSTYQWYLGLSAIPGATSATFSATLPGVYTVDIISAQGCVTRATGSVTLTLQVKPRVDFSFDKFCAGSATVFTDLSDVSNSSPASYAWKFGDGGTSAIRNPSHTYTTPGTYNATLIVTPQNCPALRDSIVKPVIVLAPPAPIRYASVNAVKSRDLQLQARPFPQASFSWIPSVGLNNPSIINPIFNYTSEQEYKIRITTPEGCLVIDTLLVRMFENRDILLPRGFSPNGDGKNDKLIPHLVGITTLRYFRVYDRWGQLIYQTNIIGEGWDGTYKGVKQPMETYVWMAEGVDIDGNVIKQTGKTILLR